jgi:hypothetical protein
MRSAKILLFSSVVMASLAGSAMLLGTSPSEARPVQNAMDRNHWRHHDGRWSYWDTADKRWYYTDGSHWYYHNGKAWSPYRFDRHFGRDGFERGRYAPPAAGTTVVVPTHEVYVPR